MFENDAGREKNLFWLSFGLTLTLRGFIKCLLLIEFYVNTIFCKNNLLYLWIEIRKSSKLRQGNLEQGCLGGIYWEKTYVPYRIDKTFGKSLYRGDNPHLTSWFCKDELDPQFYYNITQSKIFRRYSLFLLRLNMLQVPITTTLHL